SASAAPSRRSLLDAVTTRRAASSSSTTVTRRHPGRPTPSTMATQIAAAAAGPSSCNRPGGNFPVPNVPSWVNLLVGVFFAVVKKVAEAAEKIVDDVSEAFPGNNSFKKVASRIKVVVDDIEKDEEKAEALIEKVDEIEKEMDSVVDSLMENVKKERSSINKSVKGADVDRKHK
ncbi:hypothetical protein ZWY2020_056342, partial [Hordeum vulgare]